MNINDEVYVPSLHLDHPITKTRITQLWASETGTGYMVQGFDNVLFTEDQIDASISGLIEKHLMLQQKLVRSE